MIENKQNQLSKRIERLLNITIIAILIIMAFGTMPASATSTGVGDVDTMFNNFNSFAEGIVVWVGRALLLFGAVKFGMSFQSHDPSQRSQGLLFVLSGVIVALAPQIISYIAG